MSRNVFQLSDEEVNLAYLAIQTLSQIGINSADLTISIRTDALRAALRNNRSRKLGMPEQQVQEYYENNARLLAEGKWGKS